MRQPSQVSCANGLMVSRVKRWLDFERVHVCVRQLQQILWSDAIVMVWEGYARATSPSIEIGELLLAFLGAPAH